MTLALRLLRPPFASNSSVGILLRQQYVNTPIMPQRLHGSSSTRTDKSTRSATPPPPVTSKVPPPNTRPVVASSSTTPAAQCPKKKELSCPSSKSRLSRQAVRQNVQGYMFTRFFDYVKNYDKLLEKNFPSAMRVYRVFVDGVRDFFNDMKRYLRISRIVRDSPDGLKAINRKELELYMQMPRDMVKVAPALIGSSLPMVGYAVLPLVFMFPFKWLTSHFWTLQQRIQFQQIQMQHRLQNNRPVFRLLQEKLHNVEKHPRYCELKHILGLLGSGFHPSVESIIRIKEIFAQPPYNLYSLSGKHVKLLNALHGVPSGWFARYRLFEHAFLVHNMDLAIMREGGVHNLPLEALRYSCFIRGLNPSNLSNEEMIEWLRKWIKVSTAITEEHISLFLHLPIFLGYNHPNNWQLIYENTRQKD